jgi:hypothetical protein
LEVKAHARTKQTFFVIPRSLKKIWLTILIKIIILSLLYLSINFASQKAIDGGIFESFSIIVVKGRNGRRIETSGMKLYLKAMK